MDFLGFALSNAKKYNALQSIIYSKFILKISVPYFIGVSAAAG
jgi:hypothetical protein